VHTRLAAVLESSEPESPAAQHKQGGKECSRLARPVAVVPWYGANFGNIGHEHRFGETSSSRLVKGRRARTTCGTTSHLPSQPSLLEVITCDGVARVISPVVEVPQVPRRLDGRDEVHPRKHFWLCGDAAQAPVGQESFKGF